MKRSQQNDYHSLNAFFQTSECKFISVWLVNTTWSWINPVKSRRLTFFRFSETNSSLISPIPLGTSRKKASRCNFATSNFASSLCCFESTKHRWHGSSAGCSEIWTYSFHFIDQILLQMQKRDQRSQYLLQESVCIFVNFLHNNIYFVQHAPNSN